jgi:hypothetical protein
MSLHDDLLEQTVHLATIDARRPKQANLRRAVSASYYALFHLLTSAASALYAADLGLASRINRTHNHIDMKKASSMIANDKLPKGVQPPGGGYTSPADLKIVANAFVTLQQARHEADYDLARTFRRQETLAFIQTAHFAFAVWEKVKKDDYARLYLGCFLLWKRWDEDPR